METFVYGVLVPVNPSAWYVLLTCRLTQLQKSAREEQSLKYKQALKLKFAHMPEIRKVDRHRVVPRAVKKAGREKTIMIESRRRKRENESKHSAPGTVKAVAERAKGVVAVDE